MTTVATIDKKEQRMNKIEDRRRKRREFGTHKFGIQVFLPMTTMAKIDKKE